MYHLGNVESVLGQVVNQSDDPREGKAKITVIWKGGFNVP